MTEKSHVYYLWTCGSVSAVGFSGRQRIMLVMVYVFLTVWTHGWLAVTARLPLSPKNNKPVKYSRIHVDIYSKCILKGCRNAPDLVLLTGGVILFIVTELELLTVIHLLMKTWKDDQSVYITHQTPHTWTVHHWITSDVHNQLIQYKWGKGKKKKVIQLFSPF